METWVWILLIAVVVVVTAIAVWLMMRQRRSQQLRQGFGPEYQRAVSEHGGRRRAEQELTARKQRVERFDIQPLAPGERDRFAESWRSVQAQFVDDPVAAIHRADDLIADVMRARGYPIGDFESRAADVSVDHPRVVTNYRAAHAIADRNDRGEASTEDLREALVHYRSLFDELLDATSPSDVNRRQEAQR